MYVTTRVTCVTTPTVDLQRVYPGDMTFVHSFVPKRFPFSFEELVVRSANLHFAVS